jgi:hypothetical protein
LRNDVVGVTPGEARTLEKVHDLGLGNTLAVERVLVLLQTDGAAEVQLRLAGGETTIGIVKDNLDVGREGGRGAGSFV